MRIDSKSQKDASADVAVRVRRTGVVDIEQTIVAVLVVVATDVDARVRRVEVPVIARRTGKKHRHCTDSPAASYDADFDFLKLSVIPDGFLRGGMRPPSRSPL